MTFGSQTSREVTGRHLRGVAVQKLRSKAKGGNPVGPGRNPRGHPGAAGTLGNSPAPSPGADIPVSSAPRVLCREGPGRLQCLPPSSPASPRPQHVQVLGFPNAGMGLRDSPHRREDLLIPLCSRFPTRPAYTLGKHPHGGRNVSRLSQVP